MSNETDNGEKIVVDEIEISDVQSKTDVKKNTKKKRKPMSKESINGIVVAIVEIIVGILLLIKPVGFTRGIIITFGVVTTLIGAINIIDYFRTPAEIAAKERSLVSGTIMVIFGVFCVCNSNWFISTFPALTVIYGVFILILGISSIEDMIDMIRLKNKNWVIQCVLGVLAIVFACVIFANPFASANALWIFVAISILVEAIIKIISICIKYLKTSKR